MKKRTHNLMQWIKQSMFITALLFSTSAISQNNIGRVIHSSGELVATNNGEARMLSRGSNIAEGDIINSGSTSTSQLRMMDGALIALRQNTEMHFEQYRFDNNNKSIGSSIFSLLRGGFKTISGLIGKYNKQNYKVKTAFTTMGIRGTNYGITICSQGNCSNSSGETLKDGLYASVIDGEISSTNETGLYIFSNDEYFYIADAGSEPQSLLQAPGVIFGQNLVASNPDGMEAGMVTDNSLDQGALVLTNVDTQNAVLNIRTTGFETGADLNTNVTALPIPDIASSPGDTIMFGYFQGTPVSQTLVADGTGTNQFTLDGVRAGNGEFVPVTADIAFGPPASTRTLVIANATANDVGSMTIGGTDVGWGRWSGNSYEVTDNGTTTSPVSSLHYVIAKGGLTTPAQIGAMTGSFSYTTVGGTNATDLNGNVAASVANVNMGVSFGASPTIDTFSVATSVGGIDYQVELTTAVVIPTATIDKGMTMNLIGNALGTCPTCGGQASLGFVGAQAEGAITNYSIADAGTGGAITGTAILNR